MTLTLFGEKMCLAGVASSHGAKDKRKHFGRCLRNRRKIRASISINGPSMAQEAWGFSKANQDLDFRFNMDMARCGGLGYQDREDPEFLSPWLDPSAIKTAKFKVPYGYVTRLTPSRACIDRPFCSSDLLGHGSMSFLGKSWMSGYVALGLVFGNPTLLSLRTRSVYYLFGLLTMIKLNVINQNNSIYNFTPNEGSNTLDIDFRRSQGILGVPQDLLGVITRTIYKKKSSLTVYQTLKACYSSYCNQNRSQCEFFESRILVFRLRGRVSVKELVRRLCIRYLRVFLIRLSVERIAFGGKERALNGTRRVGTWINNAKSSGFRIFKPYCSVGC
jgi:hypothetical protein